MSGQISQEASLTAENTFTAALTGIVAGTRVSVSVSGSYSATVTLQRRVDGSNYRDVTNWTSETESTYVSDEKQDLRLGIKSGDFTSGTAVCRIGHG